MSGSTLPWVLAFDSSCGVCRQMSREIERTVGSQIEVLPLTDPSVQQWRAQVYGEDAPWAPTLIHVTGRTVRAWTGRGMAVPMLRAIGLRSTVRVLRALGETAAANTDRPTDQRDGKLSGQQFFRGAAMAGATAGGLVLFGRLPAMAAPNVADEWVNKNLHNLPRTFDDFVRFDVAHRRSIFGALPAEDRSRLRVTQLERYRRDHSMLSTPQSRVLEDALRLAKQTALFDGELTENEHRQLEELRVAAIGAYGTEEGRNLFTMLGPTDVTAQASCGCNCESDWCDHGCICCGDCNNCWCSCRIGCGTLLMYQCRGTC